MSVAASFDVAPSLVDLLLAEQQQLHAVDEFSAWHDTADAGDAHGKRFETLIPSSQPGTGQQWAFAVDLDACTGCKACVTACHSRNGLEPGETWRKVGEIEAAEVAGVLASADARIGSAYRQTITTACHHCEDPACAAGCPVQAYVKDAATGVVIHLDDQCIGCRYCQLTCPYDVPQFSDRLGIVRKCDMCHGRLAAGEAPACVQGCPNQAISIEIVDVARSGGPSGLHAARGPMLLPVVDGAMPLSSLTRPTTRYHSARSLPPSLQAVESAAPVPADGHAPLAVMLVLSQASIGTLLFDALFATAFSGADYGPRARLVALLVAAVLGLGGLAASIFHLGRPQWAFRAFLGLRTSWMSREIVAFGGFAAALVAALGTTAAQHVDAGRLAPGAHRIVVLAAGLDPAMRAGALAAGLAGLFCSIWIYAVTGRPLWRADRTGLRFASTALLLGAAVATVAWNAGGVGQASERPSARIVIDAMLPCIAFVLLGAKLVWERGRLVRGMPGHDEVALARTRALLGGSLAPAYRVRVASGVVGAALVALAGVMLAFVEGTELVVSALHGFGWIGLAGCLAGEIAERRLFFTSEAMRGMPGSGLGSARSAHAFVEGRLGRSA